MCHPLLHIQYTVEKYDDVKIIIVIYLYDEIYTVYM